MDTAGGLFYNLFCNLAVLLVVIWGIYSVYKKITMLITGVNGLYKKTIKKTRSSHYSTSKPKKLETNDNKTIHTKKQKAFDQAITYVTPITNDFTQKSEIGLIRYEDRSEEIIVPFEKQDWKKAFIISEIINEPKAKQFPFLYNRKRNSR